ncbi:tRNA lysidine(34) synthetase TilS [Desulfobulbus rhabdoformis]|uniref:tRNA lysidine(34) synthetase TilS n=1 Tax=Desulfobulbus rhabdoformis TaxID=34032 RepID=UPI001964FC9C|nr:tRNA lysidine(34) synthetase TilS [Desulfobulbus rhabdoformis]MBM9616545.1 tRNA lysidine(34) synthetase TilS [Desulfobulbus rhabdoformis]
MAPNNSLLHPLEYKISQLIAAQNLLQHGQRLLVGVSAGPDSMALLYILAALRARYTLDLVAAYIDHGLRPMETAAEWDCVQTAANRLGCRAVKAEVHVRERAKRKGQSLEQAARELRYQAFAKLAEAENTELLAVAHTADDQVEEVLLRLFRGGGLRALSGMRYRSGTTLRPLLDVRKDVLLDYLDEKGVAYCQDSSNSDRQFVRNRVRLELLPLLEREYDPGIRQALLKTAANLQQDEDLLASLLEDCWKDVVSLSRDTRLDLPLAELGRKSFKQLHPALQRRLLEKLLWKMENTARYEQILSLCTLAVKGKKGQELHLAKGLRVQVQREFLLFFYPQGRGALRGRL